MNKAKEIYVITGCCNIEYQFTTSRVAAVRALGEVTHGKSREEIRDFLEERTGILHEIPVANGHWRSVVRAAEVE